MSGHFKYKNKLFTSSTNPLNGLSGRVAILEDNEYKVTYYEIVSTTSGTITPPTGATFNDDEFGDAGNAILSTLATSGKPNFQTPLDGSGNPVTVSLNTTTGAWITSGAYVDPDVAIIYSIKIRAVDYQNLTYDNIIEYEEINQPISLNPEEVVITDASGNLDTLSLGASQSIRRNAANNAFEAYTPSSGGGNGFNSITYSGQYKINGFFAVKSASTNWVGAIYLQPYVIGLDHTITELGLEVTTNTAGATVRLAVYQDNNGEPGALLDESGAIPAATAGFVGYTFASPIALTTSMKVIWLAFQVSTSALGLRVGGSWNVIGKQTTGQTSDQRSRAFTYGAYPNPIGANSNTNFNIPCMWVRVQ